MGPTTPDPLPAPPPRALGAVLAGGASRRFGSPKAFAPVGGARLVDRVVAAMRQTVSHPVLIAKEPERFSHLGLPVRPDIHPGGGPLAGIETALHWAVELGFSGALVVACDMPFVSPALLRRLVELAAEAPDRALAPESASRFGLEPLCAWYPVGLLATVEERLERGERATAPLLLEACAKRIPREEVRHFADPELLFFNVNTRADQQRADRIARQGDEQNGES